METTILGGILMLAAGAWGVQRRVKPISENEWARGKAKEIAGGLLSKWLSGK